MQGIPSIKKLVRPLVESLAPTLAKKREDGATAFWAERRCVGQPPFFAYNGAGFRVEQGVGSSDSVEYLYDLSGNEMSALVPGTSNLYTSELFDNGRHWVTFNGAAQFLHTDWLGTLRAVTNLSGATNQQCTVLPFGDDLSCTSSITNYQGISGSFLDSYVSLDHFLYRQYTGNEGRWATPDPAGLSVADPSNPQTWNRYAYVLNNPVSFTDPTGLVCEPFCDDGSMDDDSGWTGQNFDTGAGCDPTRDSFCIFNPRTPFPRTSGGQSGFSFGFGSSFDGSSLLCGESVGLPCGLPIDTSIWNVLGITAPQMNCMPVCDATNAANNGPDPGAVLNSMKQYVKAQTQNCYNGFHQTTTGKIVQAFSALALFPVASNYQSNDLALGAEILGKFSVGLGSKSAGNVFAPLLGEFTSTVTTPLYALGTGADAGALLLCGAGAATSIHP
jgi:RHS repeat-associated protein